MSRIGFTLVLLITVTTLVSNGCIYIPSSSVPTNDSAPPTTPSPSQPESSTVETSEANKPSLVISDKVRLGPLDYEALFADYPGIDNMSCAEMLEIPMEDYGWYYSDKLFLEEASNVLISLESDCPVGASLEGYQFSGGIWLQIEYIAEQEECEIHNIFGIESGNVQQTSSGDWEAKYVYRTSKTGFYLIELMNDSGESVSCEYCITVN